MNTVYPASLTTPPEGSACLDGLSLTQLAHNYKTPLYVMDHATLKRQCQAYTHTLARVYPDALVVFAGKANLNLGILNILADEGLGVDVVSGGELFTALKSRIKPENIVFHGNNKSREELEMAVENHIRIVVDHLGELYTITQVAELKNIPARIMLRLKPEIEAHTHDYIKTGHIDSKFGIDKRDIFTALEWIQAHSILSFLGIHSHIGSQIFELQPYEDLADIMAQHMLSIIEQTGFPITELNLGGGIGIHYTNHDDPPRIEHYLETMTTHLKNACEQRGLPLPKLIVEPGRSIVGPAGVTLYTVGAIKSIPGIKEYIFVDGGMADNPRPMMYQAQYTFQLVNKPHEPATHVYTIAGKYCESGDILAKDVHLPEAQPGDILAVYGTGAYNYSMASHYNRSAKPAMILVQSGDSRVLVRRETYEDLIQFDMP